MMDRFKNFCRQEGRTLISTFHRQQDRGFAFGAPTSFARALATDVGVIDFHQTAQAIVLISVSHRGSQFAQHQAGAFVVNFNQFAQAGGRNAALVGSHEVNRSEPLGQRQFSAMKHRACGDRNLVTAVGTLVPGMTRPKVSVIGSTARTDKAVGPAPSLDFFKTAFLGGKSSGPLGIRSRFLLHTTPNLY